jgi:hypothetical protein
MEMSEKILKAIDLFMKRNYPEFSKESTKIISDIEEKSVFVCYGKETGKVFAMMNENTGRLRLRGEMYNKLKALFGDNFLYIVCWFNKEFGWDVKKVSNLRLWI